MTESKKQNTDKTEMFSHDIDLIDSSGYEGFCFGVDVVLHVLGRETLPSEVISILEKIRDDDLHMPRREVLSEAHQKGYELFVRELARRALKVLKDNVDLGDDPEGDGGRSFT